MYSRSHPVLHCVALLAVLILPLNLAAADPERPTAGLRNGAFEATSPGAPPEAWTMTPSSAEGYTVSVVAAGRSGNGLELRGETSAPRRQVRVGQEIDATPFRGRPIRLSAWAWSGSGDAPGEGATDGSVAAGRAFFLLQTELPGGEAYGEMWQVDVEPDTPGGVEGEEAKDDGGWRRVELVGRVHPAAVALRPTFLLSGPGTVRFDDVELETLDEARIGHRPPAPLSPRGRANLLALARLLPLVRYFHPSDAAAGADWEGVTLAAVERMEGASAPAELARRLEAFFRPLAPTLAVWPADTEPPPSSPVAGAEDGRRMVWHHRGLGTGGAYRSERIVLPAEEPPVGYLSQRFRAGDLAGTRVRATALGRLGTGVHTGAGGATFALLALGEGGDEEAVLAEAPLQPGPWKEISLQADVPDHTTWLRLELRVRGDAVAFLDDVSLAGKVAHGDFEDGAPGLEPLGWEIDSGHPAHALRARLMEVAGRDGLILRLERHPAAEPAALVPPPDSPQVFDLGGGVRARLPLSLPVDEAGRTLPRPAGDAAEPAVPSHRPAPDYFPAVEDRTTRLAAVVHLWGALHHFYPYFDLVDPGARRWYGALERTLIAAAVSGGDDFRPLLQAQVHTLADGHGWVVSPTFWEALPPLVWDRLDGEIIVTAVTPEAEAAGVALGDRVLAVDGVPVGEALARVASRVSASTDGHLRHLALRFLGAGPPGTAVELSVEPFGGAAAGPRRVELPRTVPANGWDRRGMERPETVADLADGIVYYDLTRATAEDFQAALPRLEAAQGLVFDLRGYPRGNYFDLLRRLAGRPLSSARWRIPEVWLPDRAGPGGEMAFSYQNWTVLPVEPRFTAPAVFLTDASAVSTSETLLAIVQHYDLAEIAGETTAGTNGNVNRVNLPGGWWVLFTGMRVTRHDGAPHHGVGIVPDLPVRPTREGVAAGRDEVLERAVARLRQRNTAARP